MCRLFVRMAICSLVALGAVIVNPVVHAGEKAAAKENEKSFQGAIGTVDFKANTFGVKDKAGSMTFQVAPDCKFYADHVKENAKFTDFKVGDHVEVYYTVDSGVMNAHRIAQVGAHAKKKENHGE